MNGWMMLLMPPSQAKDQNLKIHGIKTQVISITKGGQYWYDNNVGFIRIYKKILKYLNVIVCAQKHWKIFHENIYESFPVIDE